MFPVSTVPFFKTVKSSALKAAPDSILTTLPAPTVLLNTSLLLLVILTSLLPVYVKLFAIPSNPSKLVLNLLCGTVKLIIWLLAILSTICLALSVVSYITVLFNVELISSPPIKTCLLSVASPISPERSG